MTGRFYHLVLEAASNQRIAQAPHLSHRRLDVNHG